MARRNSDPTNRWADGPKTADCDSHHPIDPEKKSIDEIIEPVLESLATDFTDGERQRVIDLLRSHDDLFSTSTFDMGWFL